MMAGPSNFPIPDTNSAAILNTEEVRMQMTEGVQVIQKKIDEGKELSSAEVVEYNQTLRSTIVSQFTKIGEKISSTVELKPGDSPEVMKTKSAAGKVIHNYLADVTDWLMKKVELIYKKFVEGAKWCYEQLKSALQKLYDVWFN